MEFVVELQPGCWLIKARVDPVRTLVLANARRFKSKLSATRQLSRTRKLSGFKFVEASIYDPDFNQRAWSTRDNHYADIDLIERERENGVR